MIGLLTVRIRPSRSAAIVPALLGGAFLIYMTVKYAPIIGRHL